MQALLAIMLTHLLLVLPLLLQAGGPPQANPLLVSPLQSLCQASSAAQPIASSKS